MKVLGRYAKALVLLALIILAAIADVLDIGLGLDIEHYIGLLVADLMVFLVPNKEPDNSSTA